LEKLYIVLIILTCLKAIFGEVNLNKTFETYFVLLYEIDFFICFLK